MQVAGLDLQSSVNEPTNVLCLLNMVSEEELMDDEEYDGGCLSFVFVRASHPLQLAGVFYTHFKSSGQSLDKATLDSQWQVKSARRLSNS